MDDITAISDLPTRSEFLTAGPTPFWERLPPSGGPRAVRLEGGVLLTRFEDCRQAFADRRLVQGNLAILEANPTVDPAFVARRRHAILDMEGEDHMRLRKLAMPALSPAAAELYRAHMRRIMGELIDAVADQGRCEAVAALCRPYPVPVVCAVLGVPPEDIDFFSYCAEAWTRWIRKGLAEVPAAMTAHAEMDAYLGKLVARRRSDPGEDMVTALIQAEEDGDRLSGDEIVHLIAALIVAGVDTTRYMLASALHLFASHPEAWARLARESERAPQAVEEVLRYAPVAALLRRVAADDIAFAGLALPKGTTVFISPAAANRDPDAYPDPDRFSIERDGARPHLTFAGGRKHCLGAHLARAELQEALILLARRLPGLELDGDPVWADPLAFFQGALELPIRWRR